MNGNHLTGIGVAGLLVYAVARFAFGAADAEALELAAAGSSVGGTIAHIFTGPGLVPALRRAIFGAAPDATASRRQ